MEQDDSSQIVVPITISEAFKIKQEILKAWEEYDKASENVDKAFSRLARENFSFHHRQNSRHPRTREESKTELDFSFWELALEKLDITKAMTEKSKESFLEKVKSDKIGFNETEIIGLAQNASNIFKETSLNTIREVYKSLIGCTYYGQHITKKDNLQKVEKVFIMRSTDLTASAYTGGVEKNYHRPYSHHFFRFDDLLTACRLIDGKGFVDYSNDVCSFVQKIPRGQKWVDVEYFTVSVYKNGNTKVNWNENKLDTLDKFNAIGSGRENDLPDTMRKRYKSEHFHDEGKPKAEELFAVKNQKPIMDKDFSFFPTSDFIASIMISLAEYPEEEHNENFITLEPSAGVGALISKVPQGKVIAVEFNKYRCEVLKREFSNAVVIEGDFLRYKPNIKFDRVIMNPPFDGKRVEAVHVVKAFSHLKPGGILVSVVPDGWFTRSDLKAVVFRDWVEKWQREENIVLEPGSFSDTQIKCRLITLKKGN